MLTRNRQMALKLESAEGSAETLAAADADLLIYDPKYEPTIDFNERNPALGSMSRLSGVPGIKTAKITGKIEVKGSGSKTVAPSWGKLLKICGFAESVVKRMTIGAITNGPFVHGETVTGGTSSATGRVIGDHATGGGIIDVVVLTGTFQSGEVLTGGTSAATATTSSVASAQGFAYDPTSVEANIPSATCALMDDGTQKKLLGCRGNLKFSGEAGKIGFFDIEIMGTQEDWTAVALFTSVPYETTLPPVLVSSGMTIDGAAPSGLIKSLNFDMKNELAPRTSINASRGILSYRITDRNITGDFDPEQVAVGTYDIHSKYAGGTTLKLLWTLANSGDGKTVKFVVPQAQIRELSDAERDKMSTHGLAWEASSALTALDRDICIIHV